MKTINLKYKNFNSNEHEIKSISFKEQEIQENILKLYSDIDFYELDPCYSKGVFYKII